MKKINIVFSTSREFKPISWLIKKFLRTEYSHVALEIDGIVYESMALGFRAISFGPWAAKQYTIQSCAIEITDQDLTDCLNFISVNLGREYSFGNLIGNGIRMLTGIKAFRDGISKMMCSEMVYRAILHKFKELPDPDFVTPKDCYYIVQEIRQRG